jgi:hypothetical protein
VLTHQRIPPLHRGAFYQFPFWWIYYSGSNKSTGKETGKTHLCALLSKSALRCWMYPTAQITLSPTPSHPRVIRGNVKYLHKFLPLHLLQSSCYFHFQVHCKYYTLWRKFTYFIIIFSVELRSKNLISTMVLLHFFSTLTI